MPVSASQWLSRWVQGGEAVFVRVPDHRPFPTGIEGVLSPTKTMWKGRTGMGGTSKGRGSPQTGSIDECATFGDAFAPRLRCVVAQTPAWMVQDARRSDQARLNRVGTRLKPRQEAFRSTKRRRSVW
eukprot:scaffold431_cov334-Pavlova_lutheri.AAC.17